MPRFHVERCMKPQASGSRRAVEHTNAGAKPFPHLHPRKGKRTRAATAQMQARAQTQTQT